MPLLCQLRALCHLPIHLRTDPLQYRKRTVDAFWPAHREPPESYSPEGHRTIVMTVALSIHTATSTRNGGAVVLLAHCTCHSLLTLN